jgi:hypothetical protein
MLLLLLVSQLDGPLSLEQEPQFPEDVRIEVSAGVARIASRGGLRRDPLLHVVHTLEELVVGCGHASERRWCAGVYRVVH